MAQSPNILKIAIAGASGRMGHMLIEAVRNDPHCQLAGALDVPSSPGIGNDATGFLGQASGVNIEADVRKGLQNSQVLIDFTRPEGTMNHLQMCRELGVKLVIGTTGFSDAQKAEIAQAAKDMHRSFRSVWGELKHWETELNTHLIVWGRTGKGAELTPQALAFLRAVSETHIDLERQIEQIKTRLENCIATLKNT